MNKKNKKLMSLLLATTLFTTCINFNSIDVDASTNVKKIWLKNYGSSGLDQANDSIKVSDGYIVGGVTYGGGGDFSIGRSSNNEALLVKLDEDGNIVWSKVFGSNYNDSIETVIEIEDGYIITVFSTNPSGNVSGGGELPAASAKNSTSIIKVDKNGTIVWSKMLDHRKYNDFIEISDGYIACGSRVNNVNNDTRGIVTKFNKDGSEVWTKTLNGGNTDNLTRIIPIEDGYMLSGSSNGGENQYSDVPVSSGGIDALICKMDLNGVFKWSKLYGEANEDMYTDMIKQGNEYIAVGHVETIYDKYPIKTPTITKLSSEGDQIWKKKINIDDKHSSFSAITATDTEIIVGEGILPVFNRGSSIIYGFDYSGNKLWSNEYKGSNTAVNEIITDGKDYILFGRIGAGEEIPTTKGNVDLLVLKTSGTPVVVDTYDSMREEATVLINSCTTTLANATHTLVELQKLKTDIEAFNTKVTNSGCETEEKTTLNNMVTASSTKVNKSITDINEATTLVATAKTSKIYENFKPAYIKTSKLITSAEKTRMKSELSVLFIELTTGKTDEQIRDIFEDLKGEIGKGAIDKDSVKDLVNTLPQGSLKDEISVSIDKATDITPLIETATMAVEKAEGSKSPSDIQVARNKVNNLPECLEKDLLNNRLNAIITDPTVDNKKASADLDLLVQAENSISLTLNVNELLFENYNGASDIEKKSEVVAMVSSSLPYDLNVSTVAPMTGVKDTTNKIDINNLQIKSSKDTDYKTVSQASLNLVAGAVAGKEVTHSLDIKLIGDSSVKYDSYRGTLKFEAMQK